MKALIASRPATRYDNTNGNQYKRCALNTSVIVQFGSAATYLRHILSTTTTTTTPKPLKLWEHHEEAFKYRVLKFQVHMMLAH